MNAEVMSELRFFLVYVWTFRVFVGIRVAKGRQVQGVFEMDFLIRDNSRRTVFYLRGHEILISSWEFFRNSW